MAGWHYSDWWMMGIGMLFWLVLLGLAVWLVVRATGRERSEPLAEGAEEILRRRFAAGEIDAEEYERRLEVLRRP
ncbi:MAG: SHOCT domain-containing protein [Candidatus Limnocylindria bacterium]